MTTPDSPRAGAHAAPGAPAIDRRVARTHRALRDALFASIRERGWEDVTIQDLCRRADVGRSTFYTHFADKEDVLVSGLAELRERIRAQVAASDRGPLAFAGAMFEHARDHWWIVRALAGTRAAERVRARFVEVVSDLVEDEVARVAPRGPKRDATVRYVAGAFVELIVWSLETKEDVSSEEVVELFHRVTRPVLEHIPRLDER